MMHKQSLKTLKLWIGLYKVVTVFIINIIKKPKMSQEFCDYIGSSSTLVVYQQEEYCEDHIFQCRMLPQLTLDFGAYGPSGSQLCFP